MNQKIVDEKIYTKILKEVNRSSYLIAKEKHPLLQSLWPYMQNTPFYGVCLGSGSVLETPLIYHDFEIPARSEILVKRTLRYCNHNGILHLNADDDIIFPTKKGTILRIARKDAPDHYIKIATFGGLEHIADAYRLPEKSAGPIKEYVEGGALFPIMIGCPSDVNFIKVEDRK